MKLVDLPGKGASTLLEKRKVLYVEDDAANLALVKVALVRIPVNLISDSEGR